MKLDIICACLNDKILMIMTTIKIYIYVYIKELSKK